MSHRTSCNIRADHGLALVMSRVFYDRMLQGRLITAAQTSLSAMAFWDPLYGVLMMKTVCSAKILLYKHLHKAPQSPQSPKPEVCKALIIIWPSPPWTTDSLELLSFTVALSPSCVSECPCWRFLRLCLCYFRKCPALPSDSLKKKKNCRSRKKKTFPAL